MKAMVVCHAGAGVGLGHLSRALVIAKALREHFAADVRWVIQSEPLARADLGAFPHRFVPPDEALLSAIEAERQRGDVDLVVFDLQPQRVPAELGVAICAWRAQGTRVVAIDGLLALRPDLDLIFIPSFQFKPPADLKPGAPIVHGWDCFLLDGRLAPAPWVPGRSVLALTGGSDATQLGRTWPLQLDQVLPEDTELHWVTGPFAPRPRWPAAPRIHMTEHLAPAGLGPLMQGAHYAVTVYGVSFFELLYLGVPTVVFSPYGGKDSAEMQGIADAGVALVAADEREATERLQALMADDELARGLSMRARAALSVSGAQRLCSEIEGLMAR
jgi:spore coat polysaccharide biosynthesis predicted glycosyltransferase SpsG